MDIDYSKAFTRQEGLSLLKDNWKNVTTKETVSINECIGRVTYENIYSVFDAPVHRTAALDGIAVSYSMFEGGDPDTSCWTEGKEYVYADTGDDFPDDFDTVIAIEDVEIKEGKIKILDSYKKGFEKGSTTKPAGSFCKKGELLVPANTKITPMMASCLVIGGIQKVNVIAKPKIFYIPTGDELVGTGSQPKRGQTMESNSIMVKGMLEEMGAEVIRFPIIKDNKEELENALDAALKYADMIILNGGTSKGTEDYNAEILKERGSIFRHGVKAGPGKPLAISLIDNKPVINVPGPPMPCWIALDWCIRGLISKYYGIKDAVRPVIKVKLADDLKKRKDFEMYYQFDIKEENGEYVAYFIKRRRSFPDVVLNTKALFIAPSDSTGYKAGETIEVELLTGMEDI